MSNSNLQYYVLICDKKQKNKFIELLSSYGTVGIQTIYGRGSVKAGAFAKALGFETEEHKVVLSGLLPTLQAEKLTELLKTQHHFGRSNTGIAFSVAVEGLCI